MVAQILDHSSLGNPRVGPKVLDTDWASAVDPLGNGTPKYKDLDVQYVYKYIHIHICIHILHICICVSIWEKSNPWVPSCYA